MLLNTLDQVDIRRSVQALSDLQNLIDLIQQEGFVTRSDRDDMVHRQIAQHAAFDLDLLDIGLPFHFRTGFEFHLR